MRITIFDIETSKKPYHLPWAASPVENIGPYISTAILKCDNETHRIVFNHNEYNEPQSQSLQLFKEIIENSDLLVGHNLKFELVWLKHLGIDFSEIKLWCTQVSEYLIRGQVDGNIKGTYSLDGVASHYGLPQKHDLVKEYWESGYDTAEILLGTLLEYNEQDVKITEAIFQKQVEIVKRRNQIPLVTLQNEQTKVLVDVEYNGMMIDESYLVRYGRQCGEEIREIDGLLSESAGFNLNLDSGTELSCLLFGGFIRVGARQRLRVIRGAGGDVEVKDFSSRKRLPLVKDLSVYVPGVGFKPDPKWETSYKGVYATNKNILKKLMNGLKQSDKDKRIILELIEKRSRLKKIVESVESKKGDSGSLLKYVVGNRVHPNMNQTITATGRLSSSRPNLQNQSRSKTSQIKQAFVSEYNDC